MEAVYAVWPRMVDALYASGRGRTLAAMLKNMDQGWPHHFEGETLVLGMKHDALRARVQDVKLRTQIEDQLIALLGTKVLIRVEVMNESTRPKPGRPPLHALPPTSRVRQAAEIFEEMDDEEPDSSGQAPDHDDNDFSDMSEGDTDQP